MNTFIFAFVIILILNLAGFAWAYKNQSDHSTDLIYSVSFLVTAWAVLLLEQDFSLPALVIVSAVSIWALRLGSYLFSRIKKIKRDERFDEMRKNFWSFLGFWAIQIVTVWLVLLPVIIFLSKKGVQFSWVFILGLLIWLGGFVLESVADYQKSLFKSNLINKGKFISTGVWSVVRYPNYAGEILCWSGIFIAVSSYLVGFDWLVIVSPLWITFLLVFVSGIPLIENSQAKRYGHLALFRGYKWKTKKLIPGIW